jgi:hypothetical protein
MNVFYSVLLCCNFGWGWEGRNGTDFLEFLKTTWFLENFEKKLNFEGKC